MRPEERSASRDFVTAVTAPGSAWLVWSVGLVVLAWAPAYWQLSLAGDEWLFLFPDPPDFRLSVGRWLGHWLNFALGDTVVTPFLSGPVAAAILALSAAAIAVAAGVERPWDRLLFVLVVCVNPLHIEVFSFDTAHLGGSIALVGATLAALLVTVPVAPRPASLLAAVTLLMAALASYQPSVLVYAGGVAVILLVGWSNGTQPARRVARTAMSAGVVFVAGIVAYLVSWRIVDLFVDARELPAAGYRLGEGYATTPGQWFDSVGDVAGWITQFWTESTTAYPLSLKILTLAIVALGALRLARGPRTAGAVSLVAVVLTLAIPFSLWLPRLEPVRRYSTISSASLLVGAWVVVSMSDRRRWERTVTTALVLLLALGSAATVGRSFTGQVLSNQRDLAFANRLLARIELEPVYQERIDEGAPTAVAIVGRTEPYFDDRPFDFRVGDSATAIVGCDAISCQTVRLLSALNLLAVGPSEFRRAAVPASLDTDDLASWPSPASVQAVDGVVVVVLGDP